MSESFSVLTGTYSQRRNGLFFIGGWLLKNRCSKSAIWRKPAAIVVFVCGHCASSNENAVAVLVVLKEEGRRKEAGKGGRGHISAVHVYIIALTFFSPSPSVAVKVILVFMCGS